MNNWNATSSPRHGQRYVVARISHRSKKNLRYAPVLVGIGWLLRADVITKADGGEADEGEVKRVQIIPAFQRRVERSGATCDDAGHHAQVEQDPEDARLPLVQIYILVVVACGW